ncbi:MAG: hypothetical protein ISS31_00605 [Kiritimatiellae bacterium]|nr:hypothetical protein [Kiritimatiellia bacterium]
MKKWLGLAIVLFATSALAATPENLLENGSFDDPKDPFKGWMVDYAWTGSSVYMGNKNTVSLVPRDGMKKTVLKITPKKESKVESKLIPYEYGARYRCTMDIKASKGAPTRVYFAGYRWLPGIRPHDEPYPGETRMVYKSKAETGFPTSWKKVTLDFPMQKLSSAAKKHLRQVRFFSVYVWTAQGVSIDNVKVYKLP